ncbi:MAG: hypothetical protein WD872_13865 [Pirellulaceae bacterium]
MALSLRLSKQLDQWLAQAASLAGVTKSQYVRDCLEERKRSEDARPTAYELGKDLFGKYGSGRGDLSRNSEKSVKEIISAKARRRRHGAAGRAV